MVWKICFKNRPLARPLKCRTKGPFTLCGNGNVGVGLFHCIAAESVHMRVLHVAVATAVIAANFVCFALFTVLENSMWICFDVRCCKIQEL